MLFNDRGEDIPKDIHFVKSSLLKCVVIPHLMRDPDVDWLIDVKIPASEGLTGFLRFWRELLFEFFEVAFEVLLVGFCNREFVTGFEVCVVFYKQVGDTAGTYGSG